MITAWIDAQDWSDEGRDRPEAVRVLFERLVHEHGLSGSYRSVLRFVRRRAPKPSIRPVRRVETRPSAQAQVDWATRKVFVHELGGVTALRFFLMTLSHARLSPMRCYGDAGQLAWLDAHAPCPTRLRLATSGELRSQLEDDYGSMITESMFAQPPPTFEIIAARLAELEEQINAHLEAVPITI